MSTEPSTPSAGQTIAPSPEFAAAAHVQSIDQYQTMYRQSIEDPDKFWGEIAGQFVWDQKWDRVRDFTFSDNVSIRWFEGGKTNITVNALDRHLEKRGDQVALIWEGNEPGEDAKITYRELHREVCQQ